MKKVLRKEFFNHSALTVAPELLGKYLVRKMGEREVFSEIVEVEAYDGPQDKASHAHRGRTKRTEVMFGEPGTIYVYLIYGMYEMLNIVTGEKGYPSAILIRAVRSGIQYSNILQNVGILDGPGKLTRALRITRTLNGKALGKKTGLWVEDWGVKVSKQDIQKTPRVGVSYAGEWAGKPYRFVLKGEKR